MEGGGGWKEEVDGRGRWMEGGGGWREEVDGSRRWMEGRGGWKEKVDGRGRWMEGFRYANRPNAHVWDGPPGSELTRISLIPFYLLFGIAPVYLVSVT